MPQIVGAVVTGTQSISAYLGRSHSSNLVLPDMQPVRYSLPYGWIPKNGNDFLRQFLSSMQTHWIRLCMSELRELDQQGITCPSKDASLLQGLLIDAERWADFQSFLQTETDDISKFSQEYNRRHNEVMSEEVKKMVQELLENEFNLVSINEAHKSTSTATNMKRLSWFVFLQALFASSLFGMNVDLLRGNPDWRWYILVVTILLSITLTGWLVFKYNPLESWIERQADRFFHNANAQKER
ncbi:hypothetical protein BDW75DRAFT_245541 [Aspergillus navahoensis]